MTTSISSSSCQDIFSDWVPEPACESLCKGRYVPPLPSSLEDENDIRLPMELSADESQLTFEGESLLRGHVTLTQGHRYLHADQVIVERSPSTQDFEKLTASGNIHFIAPGLNICGNKAQYFHPTQHLHIEDAWYRYYDRHARGYAKIIELNSAGNILIEKGNYTTCAPFSHTWLLSAQKITLYPKRGRAIAKHIRLDLHDFPIFYFPYFNYPIDNKRHSGFLFPSYGSTTNSGIEIAIPYYWNIAPNYDLVITGKWLSERGVEEQSKFRYLTANSEGSLQVNFLPNDRKYRAFQEANLNSPPVGLNDPRIQALHGSSNRFALNYLHTTSWDHRWQMNIIFDYVHDDNYFVDLGNDINTMSTVHLPKQANLSYYGRHWSHYFNIEEYQVLQPLSKPINDEIYRRQPQWVFDALYPDLWCHLSLGLNGEMVNFNHKPQLITFVPVTTGQRFHLRPSLFLPLQESWYFFKPRIQLDWLYYALKLGTEEQALHFPSSPSRAIPLYDLDTGLIFERLLHYRDYSFIQTLEPRAYYLYVPYRQQFQYPDFDSGVMNFSYAQLFRDNRFSGRDRVGDANQVSLSLTSRLLSAQGGQEWFRASIGQIFYFRKHRVSLCEKVQGQNNFCFIAEEPPERRDHSHFIGQAELHVNPLWSNSVFVEWDGIRKQVEQASVNFQLHPSERHIVNFNYYWLRHDIAQVPTDSLHQADIALFWPINLHWQALTRWHYDLVAKQTIEILGGFEYNACCIALQIVGTRYRQSTNYFYPQSFANGIFAQVVFKGLSSIGLNNPDSKLKQKIPGYIPLYDRQHWTNSAKPRYFPPQNIPPY